MKKILISVIVYLLATSQIRALAEDDNQKPPTDKVTIKTDLLPGFLYFVKGTMELSSDSLNFTPASECFEWKVLDKIYPCHNELFKSLRFPIVSIAEIKRRNTLLIVPNRFIIKLKDGTKYKFFSFRRGRIIHALKLNSKFGG